MTNVIRHNLIERVWVRGGISNKTPVIIVMIPTKLHLGIEREMLSVFSQRLHVVAECIVSTTGLRQNVRKKTVAHADAKKPFYFSLIWTA